ncbi:DUF4124 domain-containing protein [Marinobacter profundi]|uniref:DUF4124 domain-containing protein n=1 Tax=Marinobacter profundi TaxID=2666256 RepID=A0A2G1UH76_9GAMM|nr:DUF4124 domain-containing protein [Marinobacter profundi]PHQ13856.1 hypothetical protein CLH61_16260 [Marinobacter profundi]
MIRQALPVVALMLVALPGPANAEIYRCQTASGVVFADQPCGADAETVTVRDNRVGGSLADNLPAPDTPPADDSDRRKPAAERPATCRFINSTNLRTYLARNQVVRGMTRDHVLNAFGRPPETHTVPQETWVYQTRYYDKLYELTYVYFRDGCVESVEYRKP